MYNVRSSDFSGLSRLLTQMEEDWQSSTPEQQQVIESNYKICRITFICYISGTFLALTGMGIAKPPIVWYYGAKNLSEYHRESYLMTNFIVDTSGSPWFEIIWVSQFLTSVTGAIVYYATNAVVEFLISHVCSQLKNFRIELSQVGYPTDDQEFHQLHTKTVSRYLNLRG
ncbi:hypothetical protein QAD02_017487 [Eretmocerus hayati]|uniref:Uncharacterized protein n=1 Tax=Eretmocerus hayati TaxID=131215 RepID=A0ACC2PE22_9HYME|nr:hypothetical protein QAD02_017487 [Eretmocerus hayati]